MNLLPNLQLHLIIFSFVMLLICIPFYFLPPIFPPSVLNYLITYQPNADVMRKNEVNEVKYERTVCLNEEQWTLQILVYSLTYMSQILKLLFEDLDLDMLTLTPLQGYQIYCCCIATSSATSSSRQKKKKKELFVVVRTLISIRRKALLDLQEQWPWH